MRKIIFVLAMMPAAFTSAAPGPIETSKPLLSKGATGISMVTVVCDDAQKDAMRCLLTMVDVVGPDSPDGTACRLLAGTDEKVFAAVPKSAGLWRSVTGNQLIVTTTLALRGRDVVSMERILMDPAQAGFASKSTYLPGSADLTCSSFTGY